MCVCVGGERKMRSSETFTGRSSLGALRALGLYDQNTDLLSKVQGKRVSKVRVECASKSGGAGLARTMAAPARPWGSLVCALLCAYISPQPPSQAACAPPGAAPPARHRRTPAPPAAPPTPRNTAPTEEAPGKARPGWQHELGGGASSLAESRPTSRSSRRLWACTAVPPPSRYMMRTRARNLPVASCAAGSTHRWWRRSARAWRNR